MHKLQDLNGAMVCSQIAAGGAVPTALGAAGEGAHGDGRGLGDRWAYAGTPNTRTRTVRQYSLLMFFALLRPIVRLRRRLQSRFASSCCSTLRLISQYY